MTRTMMLPRLAQCAQQRIMPRPAVRGLHTVRRSVLRTDEVKKSYPMTRWQSERMLSSNAPDAGDVVDNNTISPQSYVIDVDTQLLPLKELATKNDSSFTKEDFNKIVMPLVYGWMQGLSNQVQEKEKRIEAEIRNSQGKDTLIEEKEKRIQEKEKRINEQDKEFTRLQYKLNNERSSRYALEHTRILVEMGALSEYPDAKSNTAATNQLIRLLFEDYDGDKLCDDAKKWVEKLTGKMVTWQFEKSVCVALKLLYQDLPMDVHYLPDAPAGHYIGTGLLPTRVAATLAVLKAQSKGHLRLPKLTYVDELNRPSHNIVNGDVAERTDVAVAD